MNRRLPPVPEELTDFEKIERLEAELKRLVKRHREIIHGIAMLKNKIASEISS